MGEMGVSNRLKWTGDVDEEWKTKNSRRRLSLGFSCGDMSKEIYFRLCK